MLVRLQSNLAFRILVFLLAGSLFALSLRYVWLAFSNPLEVEIREGSSWIQVLARQAGVDIYDKTRVVFVNMNHGPMDSILKTWIAKCAPRLPGHMVARAFVLLLPVSLFGAAYSVCRRNIAGAMLAAGALYLFFIHISPMLLAGRPDTTALCELTVCGALAHQLLVTRHRQWSNTSYKVKQGLLGSVSAVVFLTSWRFLPVFAALQFVVLTKQITESTVECPPGSRLLMQGAVRFASLVVNVVISTALFVAGFALVWLPTFLIELHGNVRTYYERYFGFFSPESGWGTFQGHEFHLFPVELVEPRRGLIWLFVALMFYGFYRLRRERAQFVAWLLMLLALWCTVSYGYFKNEGGGGLHYFFEFYLFAWFFVLHSLNRRLRWGPLAQLALIGVLAYLRPWGAMLEQERQLAGARERALTFQRDVARRTRGQRIYGEETHLFKKRYQDDVVDTGDVAAAIAETGYYGDDFFRTYDSYTTELLKNPPKFVLAGLLDETNWTGVMTPTLQNLLKQQYELVLIASGSSYAYGGSQALFERKTE